MAKSKQPFEERLNEVIQSSLEEVLAGSMMPYAEHVIMERALPRVEDGLKPVQRRILYAMHELSLSPDKPHRKCARIVGDCLGKYHPHGETSVYDALVRMAQPFSMRGMLVDGHGNFGSIDGDTAAAMRYTEARMSPLALEMLRDLQKDTVPHRLNFDDTIKEPDLLPARYPNMLVNGASGIAVGLATNIPPHNLRETIDAAIHLMENPDATLDDLMALMPAPDFPTGGILLDTKEIRAAYETGRGKLTLRAKVDIEPGKSGRHLLCITEVPYQVNKAQMLEKILRLSEEKKAALGGIYDIRDESDRTGLRAVIELKRDVDPQAVLALLYRYSDLQVTFGVNMVAIAEGKPVLMGLIEALTHYIKHQKNVVTKRTQYDLEQAKHRLHILDGLITAVDNLDEIIALIRASKNAKEAKERLMARFDFTDIQAQAILDLRLQRLTGLEILTLREEHAATVNLIAKLEAILKHERKLIAVIKEELLDIAKKYGDDRRTQIIKQDEEEAALIQATEVPAPEETIVVITRGGQLRRMHRRVFDKLELPSTQNEQNWYVFNAMTDQTLLFFTQIGNCYQVPVAQIEESFRPRDRGTVLAGVLNGLEDGEDCVSVILMPNNDLLNEPDLFFFTKRGMVKRSLFSEYAVRRSKVAAIGLAKNDSVIGVTTLKSQDDIYCLSKSGMLIRFAVDEVSATGRVTRGVIGMRLAPKDRLIAAGGIQNSDMLLLISERGYMKRVPGNMIDSQRRAGKGVHSFYFNKNGNNGTYIAASFTSDLPRSFTVLTTQGQAVPFNTEDIALQKLNERGKPYVMAVLDDVVCDVIL
ncbi:MAG TPA: DNA topoisomerase 4 subunit A [Clostridiales bacterium]|nr:DNA topoisomerase 4 subunit A [Clostridiales bacterium]